MRSKNPKFIQGVGYDLIGNVLNDGTKYLLVIDDSCEEISKFKHFGKLGLISSKKIGKSCRFTKYTHSFVQVTCFTNQYINSTTRSRISIERVISICNISSLSKGVH